MQPLFFDTANDFRQWLDKNHSTKTEIWVGFWKKSSGKVGMNYAQALDEALCYGWIDGLVHKYDEHSYAQRFTPRRSKSLWSKINTQHIERLTKIGKMMPAGLTTVEAAKADGRWAKAYESPANTQIPQDFLEKLQQNQRAAEFFTKLNKAHTFHIAFQLHNAKKAETRLRRMDKIIEMLAKGEKFY